MLRKMKQEKEKIIAYFAFSYLHFLWLQILRILGFSNNHFFCLFPCHSLWFPCHRCLFLFFFSLLFWVLLHSSQVFLFQFYHTQYHYIIFLSYFILVLLFLFLSLRAVLGTSYIVPSMSKSWVTKKERFPCYIQ